MISDVDIALPVYGHHTVVQAFELPVAIGTDPALLFATIAALPENIDEAMFAGFLRRKRTPFVRGRSIGIDVPAHAEFVLEGTVPLTERRMDGAVWGPLRPLFTGR